MRERFCRNVCEGMFSKGIFAKERSPESVPFGRRGIQRSRLNVGVHMQGDLQGHRKERRFARLDLRCNTGQRKCRRQDGQFIRSGNCPVIMLKDYLTVYGHLCYSVMFY